MNSKVDVEESIVEYARFHGLAIEHANISPQSHIESLQQTHENSPFDDSHLRQIEYRQISKADEHLVVDKDAAMLIASASGRFLGQKDNEKIFAAASVGATQPKLRLELPLLRSDPDADLVAFKQQKHASIENGNLIYEPLDNERDEGLQWPSRFATLPKDIMKSIATERIEVLRDTLICMQASLKDGCTSEDVNDLLCSGLCYKRNISLDPVTPPLSPHYWPTPEPFVPSSPTCYLQLLSDPASLLGADLEAAEEAIFENDALSSIKEERSNCDNPSEGHLRQGYNQIDACLETLHLSSDDLYPAYEHKNASNLKVEPPLTPPFPPAKSVTFNNTVEEMLFDHHYNNFSPANETGNAGTGFMDHELFDTFKEAFESENRKIEEEQLQEAATTRKVKVPVIDFTLPEAPWKATKLGGSDKPLLQAQAIVKSIIKENDLPHSLTAMRKLDNSVGWTVFPSALAKVALEEVFEDDDALADYTTSTKDTDVISSVDVTYKAAGIRILRETDDEDDEALEQGLFLHPQPENLASLLRKRKLQFSELGESGIQDQLQKSKDPATCAGLKLSSRKPTPGIVANPATIKDTIDNRGYEKERIGGLFSAGTAVDNFMELRGTKKSKLTESNHFIRSTGPIPEPAPVSIGQSITVPQPEDVVIPLPLSNIIVPTTPTPFIISTELAKRRPLFSAIKALFPSAHFIERDFNKFNTTTWLKQGSITRSPIISSLAAEADLILSPSMGVLLTTLMKIKQKTLPGQKEKSEIKRKVEAVSRRYEKLQVFVSETLINGNSPTTLSSHNCMALAEFMGFCASLPCTINVIVVPAGDETLANWVVAAMVRNRTSDSISSGLLEEETQWELFLRRCGMNTFGAQAVVSALTAGVGNQVSPSKYGIFGMSSFVEMDHTERSRRFKALFDGERVLNRVSQVVDTRWRCDTP